MVIGSRLGRISAILGAAVLVAGCSSSAATQAPVASQNITTPAPQSAAASNKVAHPKIGLVMKSLANDYFKQMQTGAQAYADAHKADFDFTAVGTQSETDLAQQVDLFNTFVTQKYDVIIVAPGDSKAIVAPVAKALQAGITVINIDVALDPATMKAAGIDLAYFGPDNKAGAKLSGDALGTKLGNGAKVVILQGIQAADNAQQRLAGFMQSVDQFKLNVLGSDTANWDTDQANTLMTNWLTKYPDIQGVMCANDSMLLGAVKAIDAAGKTGKIQVVGFDNLAAVQTLIKGGTVLATVEQYGAQQAVYGIQYGIRELNGEKFTGWVQTPVKAITAADL